MKDVYLCQGVHPDEIRLTRDHLRLTRGDLISGSPNARVQTLETGEKHPQFININRERQRLGRIIELHELRRSRLHVG